MAGAALTGVGVSLLGIISLPRLFGSIILVLAGAITFRGVLVFVKVGEVRYE